MLGNRDVGRPTRRTDTTRDGADHSAVPGVNTVPGMPPVIDPRNLYSETAADKINPAWASQPLRAYVPNGLSNDVTVIDVATKQVIGTFPAGHRTSTRRAVVRRIDVVGAQQPELLPHTHRSDTGTPGRLNTSTIRTTSTSRPTEPRQSSWPKR